MVNLARNRVVNISITYRLDDNPQVSGSGIVDRDNPIGTILAFAGNVEKTPAGWKICNGDVLPIHGNEEVFNVIGYNWGKKSNGDFNLPDLRGVFLRGLDLGRGMDRDRESIGKGSAVGDFQEDKFKDHFHNMGPFWANPDGKWQAQTGSDNHYRASAQFDQTNGSPIGGIETRPKNVSINYIIRCK